MLAPQDDVLKPGPIEGLSIQLAVVIIAVASASLLVTQPALLIVSFCVVLGMAALVSVDFFVYAMVFLLPWYPFLDAKMPVRDIFVVPRFLLLASVWHMQRKSGKSLKDWMFDSKIKKGVLIFAGIATISLVVSTLRTNLDAYKLLGRLFSNLAVFFALAGWLENREDIAEIIRILLISTIGVALFGFYQEFEGSYTDFYFRLYPLQEDVLQPWVGRITSLLFHFNSLAGYLNLAIPFALGCMVLAKDRWMRYLGFICSTTATAALFLTQSRGGLVAWGGMLIVSVWFLVPRRTTRIGILATIALLVAFSAPALMQYSDRLQDVDEFTELSRLALWGSAGSMFLTHPILGVGYGNYRLVSMSYIPEVTGGQLDSHNLYLQLLAETGIFGFLAFFILIGAFCFIAVKLIKEPDPLYRIVGIGTCGAITATLIHGMVDFLFNTSPQFGALFWLVLALSIAAFQKSQRTVQGDIVIRTG